MRLVHVTTVPMTLGFLRGQIRHMKHMGFNVAAISSPEQALDAFGSEENIATISLPMTRRISPVSDLRSIVTMARTIRGLRAEIVHAHTPKAGMVAMIAAFLMRTPVRVYHLHGMPYTTASGSKRKILKLIERLSCRLANRVFCVSDSLRQQAIDDGICSEQKLIVFGGGSIGGVDSEGQFNPARFDAAARRSLRESLGIPESAPVIGFVGRVVRDKGVHELAEAWKRLKDSHPDAHLVLVGPLEPQDPVDPSVLTALREDERAHFVGMVEDTSLYYSIFDVLALPTYREGFGNVNMESASMEVPVVSTRIPGCLDSVSDGVTGTLVPARDAAALESALARYLTEPDLRRQHGTAGRQRVLRDFRQEVIWEAIYQEYCRLLKQKGLSAPKVPVKEVS